MPDTALFIDLVLALVSVELVALALWRQQTGKGPIDRQARAQPACGRVPPDGGPFRPQ